MMICRTYQHLLRWWLLCRLGRYEEAETRLSTALKLAGEGSETSPEGITLSFVKALEVCTDCSTSSCADDSISKLFYLILRRRQYFKAAS